MASVLWVIAVLSNWTVVHRMIYTYREARQLEDAQLRLAQERKKDKERAETKRLD